MTILWKYKGLIQIHRVRGKCRFYGERSHLAVNRFRLSLDCGARDEEVAE